MDKTVSLQNSYGEALTHKVTVFGDMACEEGIKVKRGHKGGINRANTLIRKGRETSMLTLCTHTGSQETPHEHSEKADTCKPE